MKRGDRRQLALFEVPAPAPAAAAVEPEVSFFRLEDNVAMLAGAGAGKTYSLVTLCLHVLGGARSFDPVSPAALCMLTFTEKAADEMRARLRARLELLGRGEGQEPELRAAFSAVGKPFPPPGFWSSVRDELGAATIGTFHAFCTQLIRRAPPGKGGAPGFELLDEREAGKLLRDRLERALLEAVDHSERLASLVTEIGFGRLSDALLPIARRIREEGIVPAFVPVADGPSLRAQFAAALQALQAATRRAQGRTAAQREALAAFTPLILRAQFERFEADLDGLRAAVKGGRDVIKELRDGLEALTQLYAATLLAPAEAELRELLVEVIRAYEERLVAREALDFTGLLVAARDLLRDHLEARAQAQRRVQVLLVDEFQDTNRLQLELVLLLTEAGAPRPISSAFEQQHQEIVALPQRRGALAVVGDRKQSIYEFRGADVGVFEVMAKAIEREGGRRVFLQGSRRSTAPLLAALNRGFAQVLAAPTGEGSPQDFEVGYQPALDDLHAVRTDAPSGPAVLQLMASGQLGDKPTADELRATDSDAIARAIRHGLSGGWTVSVSTERPARGGDVAVLFQRFTQLEVYRQALVRHGVRHRVVRGRGFYGAQEVLDLAAVLALLAAPDDARSLSVVLRSPLVGLTDAAWVKLAAPRTAGGRWRLDARAVIEGEVGAQQPLLQRFRQVFLPLLEQRGRLGVHTALELVLEGFSYRLALAAGPFAEQALANVEKLLLLAAEREAMGVSLAAFAQELTELADEAPTEAQAEVLDELDPEVVTVCTVHQAKGLEWPIVVVPDLNTLPRVENAAVRFDRALGLGLVRPRAVTELKSASAERITKQLQRRARAEHLRLLYVALTRARDRVVLGLKAPKPQANTWAAEVDHFSLLQPSARRDDVLEVTELNSPALRPPPADGSADAGLAHVERIRRVRPSAVRSVLTSVTQLRDHALCSRRFALAHLIGLEERGGLFEGTSGGGGAARGTAVHRLLELAPLGLADFEETWRTVSALRGREGLEALVPDETLQWVTRFLTSSFVRRVAPHRVERERPVAFAVPGAPSVVVRGQIDLVAFEPNAISIVDYKTTTSAGGLEPHRLQLSCYALAVRRWVGPQLPIRAGVAFLADPDVEPRFFESLQLDAVEAELTERAAVLERDRLAPSWPVKPRERCVELGCGYVFRCHAPSRSEVVQADACRTSSSLAPSGATKEKGKSST